MIAAGKEVVHPEIILIHCQLWFPGVEVEVEHTALIKMAPEVLPGIFAYLVGKNLFSLLNKPDSMSLRTGIAK